jgi:hypothetical protein
MSVDKTKVESMHQLWKSKQDAVSESPDDWYIYRDKFGTEIRRKRSEKGPVNPLFKLVSIVKITLGEAEKNAKDGE